MSESEKFLHDILNVLNGSEVNVNTEGGTPELERWFRSIAKTGSLSGNPGDISVGSDLDVKHAREAESRAKALLLRLTQEFMEQKRQQSRVEATLSDVRQQISARDAEIASLRDDQERQKKTRHLSDVSSAQQQHALKELRERQANLVQEIDARDRQLNHLKKDIETRVANFNCEREEMIKAYEAELTRIRRESSQTLEQLRKELKGAAKSEIDGKIAQKNSEFSSMQTDLQRKLAKLGDDCWAKDIELERLSKAEKSLTAKLMALSEEQVSREKKFANDSCESLAVFVSEKNSLQSELSSLSTELKDLRRERDQFEAIRTEFKKELSERQESYRLQSEELMKARQELSTARLETQHVRMECERQVAGLRQEFEVKLTAAEMEVHHAAERLSEANELRTKYKAQSMELTNVMRELGEQQLQTSHTRLDADRQLAGLRQEFEMKLNAMQGELKHAGDLLKNEAERYEDLDGELTEARRAYEAARLESLAHRENEFQSRRDLAESESTFGELQRRFEAVSGELQASRDEVKRERAAYRDLEASLRQESNRAAAFELEANLAKKRVSSLENELSSQEEVANELRVEVEARDEQISSIETTLSEERSRTANLQLEASLAKKRAAHLEGEFTAQVEMVEELQGEVEARDEQLAAIEATLTEERSRTATLELEASLAKTRAASLESDFVAQGERVEELRGELEMREGELASVESALTEERSRTAQLELEVKLSQKRVGALMDETNTQAENIRTLGGTIEEREEKIQELEVLVKSSQAFASQLESDRDAKLAAIEAVEKQLRASEERFVATRKQLQETETLMRSAQVFAEHMEADRDAKASTISHLEAEVRTAEERSEVERQGVLAAEAATRGLRAQLEQADESQRQAELTIASLQGELLASETKGVDYQRRLDEMRSQMDELKRTSDLIARERVEMARQHEQLQDRERQLRLYAGAMSREKTVLGRYATELAQEMRTIANTHPLRDYIAATDYELGKTELQLKTMPMLAIDRPKFENAVAQLMEQREFLKGVLAHTQREFETRAAALANRATSGFLAAVPPPPPAVVQAPSVLTKTVPSVSFGKVPDFIEVTATQAVTPAPLKTAVVEDEGVQWTAPERELE